MGQYTATVTTSGGSQSFPTLTSTGNLSDLQTFLTTILSGAPEQVIISVPPEEIIHNSTVSATIGNTSLTISFADATIIKSNSASSLTFIGGYESWTESVALTFTSDGRVQVLFSSIPSSVAVGGWLKIVSDSPYVVGGTALLGQALKVDEISGNSVYSSTPFPLLALYQLNVRVKQYKTGTLSLIQYTGESDFVSIGTTPGNGTNPPFVTLQSLIEPAVTTFTVSSGYSYGLVLQDCVQATVEEVSATLLADNVGTNAKGFALASRSSFYTQVDGLTAIKTRGGVALEESVVSPNSSNFHLYGADFQSEVSNVEVTRGTGPGVWVDTGCHNVDLDTVIIANSGQGMVLKGRSGAIKNSIISACVKGIEFGPESGSNIIENLSMGGIAESQFVGASSGRNILRLSTINVSSTEVAVISLDLGASIFFDRVMFKYDFDENDATFFAFLDDAKVHFSDCFIDCFGVVGTDAILFSCGDGIEVTGSGNRIITANPNLLATVVDGDSNTGLVDVSFSYVNGLNPADFALNVGSFSLVRIGWESLIRPIYEVSSLPTAASRHGEIVYVDDGASGSPCLAFSDGTNWKKVITDGTL